MNAKQLRIDGSELVQRWQCQACELIYSAQDIAEGCCVCRRCGKTKPRNEAGGSFCGVCFTIHHQEQDQKLLETARLVTDYKGPVCIGDKYWASLEQMLDGLNPDEVPEYVHTCDVNHYLLSVEDIVQNLHEEAGLEDHQDLEGVGDLAAAVDKFNSENKDVEWWSQDTSRKVATGRKLEVTNGGAA